MNVVLSLFITHRPAGFRKQVIKNGFHPAMAINKNLLFINLSISSINRINIVESGEINHSFLKAYFLRYEQKKRFYVSPLQVLSNRICASASTKAQV